jgi:hypothetical protein
MEPTVPVTAEPTWTEAPPPERPAPAAIEEPVDAARSSMPASVPESTEPPDDSGSSESPRDPYDTSAWPETGTTESAASSEQEDEEEKKKKEAESERDPLNLVPLEYPPALYAPGNSADPIHFIEPGSP